MFGVLVLGAANIITSLGFFGALYYYVVLRDIISDIRDQTAAQTEGRLATFWSRIKFWFNILVEIFDLGLTGLMWVYAAFFGLLLLQTVLGLITGAISIVGLPGLLGGFIDILGYHTAAETVRGWQTPIPSVDPIIQIAIRFGFWLISWLIWKAGPYLRIFRPQPWGKDFRKDAINVLLLGLGVLVGKGTITLLTIIQAMAEPYHAIGLFPDLK